MKEITDTLERIKKRISENIDSKGLKASGKTAESMRIEERADGGTLYGRAYFNSLEDGRPAGKVPYSFTDIIKQWILDKGLQFRIIPYKTNRAHKYSVKDRSLNAAASAIAYTIKERGTLLYRNGGRDDIYSNVINEETEELIKKLNIKIQTIAKNGKN